MNFRPRSADRHLWDTWFYDKDGEYYLFYLSNPRDTDGNWQPWDAFSLAVSRDMLHWEEKGEVFYKSDNPDDWDYEIITTGDIIRYQDRYYMTYRATQDRVEMNNIIVSDDLLNWERVSLTPVLKTDSPDSPYEHDPARTINNYVEMRDVTITQLADGTLEGLFTARLDSGPHTGRGVLGRAYSKNMTEWEMAEPLFAPGRFNVIEVPSRYEHNGLYYLLFCVNKHLESSLESPNYPSIDWYTGYSISKQFDRGFEYVPDQVLGIGDAYVGRLVDAMGETLFLHHLCGDRPAFALPKSVSFTDDGTIQLGYWHGVDSLIQGEPRHGFSTLSLFEDDGKSVCTSEINDKTCTIENPTGFGDAYLSDTYSDFVLEVDIAFDRCLSAGVVLNADVPTRTAVMATLRADRGVFQTGRSRKVYNHLAPLDVRHEYVSDALKQGRVHMKVVCRSEGFDWYIDGIHVLTTIDEDLISGSIGVFVREGRARFSNLVIAELEPEDCPNLR
jgi:beta-fructofuranosidase